MEHYFLDCVGVIAANNNKKSSALLALCGGKPHVTDGFPPRRVTYMGNVSMSWYDHRLNHIIYPHVDALNLLAHGRSECDSKNVILIWFY